MLVVSPLIALMKDQLAHLPAGLPGAMLWSGQQGSEALKTLAAIKVHSLRQCPKRSGQSIYPSHMRLHIGLKLCLRVHCAPGSSLCHVACQHRGASARLI